MTGEILLNGKRIGLLEGDTYISYRKPFHFMRIYQGFGISQKVLDELNRLGVRRIRIVYEGKEGMIIYETTLDKFIESEKTFSFTESDFQKFLSVNEMEELKNE